MSTMVSEPRQRTEAAIGPWRLRWRRFLRHRAGVSSLVVLVALIAFALAAFPMQLSFLICETPADYMDRRGIICNTRWKAC